MKTELYYYDIYPKVVQEGKKTNIYITALSSHAKFAESEYVIKVIPYTSDIYSKTKKGIATITVKSLDGLLSFEHAFDGEQQQSIRIFKTADLDKPIATLSVYSVKEDLYKKRPYLGDFHLHSTYSDGCEAPEFVAAMYRSAGFDFIPITDHFLRSGSLRAIEAYKDVDMDFKIYTGEEVHSPGNHVHIINFGSDFSVNEVCTEDLSASWGRVAKQEWLDEVAEIQKTLENLPEGVDSFVHASTLLVIKKIREGNGLAVYCHPHWLADVYNVTDGMTRLYLENNFADCFELVGGLSRQENMMQLAIYHDTIAKGIKINIVGSSDSHGTVNRNLFTKMKTMVFATENTRDDIISAVKNGLTVAIEEYTKENEQILGGYRLVSYALFLYEHYFPLQNELCFEEGRLMRCYINGDNTAKVRLEASKGQTVALRQKYFGR